MAQKAISMNLDSSHTTAATERLDWYLKAKFGLFIHWGPYSVAGAEASWPIMLPDAAEVLFKGSRRISEADYIQLPARFNPSRFDARAWVRLAQDAGMRYIVITTKHHDGFCMFDAPGTDYKITRTAYGRDICLELAEACAAAGMRLGFYYSPPDMHHPGYRDTTKPVRSNWLGEPKRKEWSGYLDYMEGHIRKLLTDYGEVSILWFDGLVNQRKYDPPRFHRLVHSLSPRTLINDRLGDGCDFVTPEQFIPKAGIPIRTGKPPAAENGGEGLFRVVPALLNAPLLGGWLRGQLAQYGDGQMELTKVPQEPYPDPAAFQPWETCMTMGQTWGYNPDEQNWKSPEQLVRNLVEVVSRGGNYLLNVGPAPDGTLPPQAIERLERIGQWMGVNHEAIHGTTYAAPVGWAGGRITRGSGQYYLHVLDWPSDGKLVIDGFPESAAAASLLGGSALDIRQVGSRLEVSVPAEARDPAVTVVKIETKGGQRGLGA
jgi:alpha-L-fucosidase